jgi:cytochrome c oxidase accessory protein FixG
VGTTKAQSPGPVKTTGLYAAPIPIYPRSVQGRFARMRWLVVAITQAVFYGLPWLTWGDRPLVLFDLGERRFYLLNLVLYPQDFIYLAALLVVCALSLFLFTVVAGRLWCGYACPQTVYSEIFMWIERQFEGDRSARMRLDERGTLGQKVLRKGGKHLTWVALALWTGFTFVGYFTPIRSLAAGVGNLALGPWELFWICFYGFATYGNAGFLREQVCKYMCPYARFQSAMFDRDTLIVSYDAARGEPRGARSRSADPKALNLGACVDCTLCVQVCPTGIDIRKGLQYECIGCGACADVCDGVMDKVGYPRGLVRYATLNKPQVSWGLGSAWTSLARPRVLAYGTVLGAAMLAMVIGLANRTTFKVDVVRDRGVMARQVERGQVENVYRLHVMNASEVQRQFRITATGLPGLQLHGGGSLALGPSEARWMPLSLRLQPQDLSATDQKPGSHPIQIHIESLTDGQQRVEKSVFWMPR